MDNLLHPFFFLHKGCHFILLLGHLDDLGEISLADGLDLALVLHDEAVEGLNGPEHREYLVEPAGDLVEQADLHLIQLLVHLDLPVLVDLLALVEEGLVYVVGVREELLVYSLHALLH